MNINPFKMISKETQKLLLGGVVGSLSYWATMAIADTQPFYPAMLKEKLVPQLPRNDELLTSIAPPAAMWLIAKKMPKLKEMAKGTILYSGPHLMARVIVNAVNPANASASAPFAMQVAPMQAATANGRIYPPRIPVAPTVVSTAVGKYR